MILSPSCCPERTRKGLNISTPLMYTEFSLNVPPLTLYCDDNSECVETPACDCIRASTALPFADGIFFKSSLFSS